MFIVFSHLTFSIFTVVNIFNGKKWGCIGAVINCLQLFLIKPPAFPMTEYFQWENEYGPNALYFKPKIFGFMGKNAHSDKLLTYFDWFYLH